MDIDKIYLIQAIKKRPLLRKELRSPFEPFTGQTMTQSYSEIKAISIHAPHAYAICMGIKKYEYRS